MKPTAFAAAVALTLPLLATTSISAFGVTTEEFVNKATISDMFEIQSGKLADTNLQNIRRALGRPVGPAPRM